MNEAQAAMLQTTQDLISGVLSHFAACLESEGYMPFTFSFECRPTIPKPSCGVTSAKTSNTCKPIPGSKLYRLAIDPVAEVAPRAEPGMLNLRGMWLVFRAVSRPVDWSLKTDPITGAVLQPEGQHGSLNAVLNLPAYLKNEDAAVTWVLKNLKQYVLSKKTYMANRDYVTLMADRKSCWSKGGKADSSEWKIEASE